MLKGHVFENQLFGNPIFAVFINTFLAGENGVINGFGNSMAVTTNGSNLTIQSGVCCIQGRFLEEDTSTTISAGTTPSYARLVLEIDLDKTNTENDFQQGYYKIITNSTTYPELTQDDIVNDVSGVYQFPLGRFQITSNGVIGYADERNFLDFNSIYDEIRDIIQGIEDGSSYVLQSTFDNSKGKIIFDNEANENTSITFEDISSYDSIEVFWRANRGGIGDSQITKEFRGSERIENPVGCVFNVNKMFRFLDNKHQKGFTSTYEITSTGMSLIAGSNYEASQVANYPIIMTSGNSVFITRIVAYKRSHFYEES